MHYINASRECKRLSRGAAHADVGVVLWLFSHNSSLQLLNVRKINANCEMFLRPVIDPTYKKKVSYGYDVCTSMGNIMSAANEKGRFGSLGSCFSKREDQRAFSDLLKGFAKGNTFVKTLVLPWEVTLKTQTLRKWKFFSQINWRLSCSVEKKKIYDKKKKRERERERLIDWLIDLLLCPSDAMGQKVQLPETFQK